MIKRLCCAIVLQGIHTLVHLFNCEYINKYMYKLVHVHMYSTCTYLAISLSICMSSTSEPQTIFSIRVDEHRDRSGTGTIKAIPSRTAAT